MNTRDEVERKLRDLSDDEYGKFRAGLGGGGFPAKMRSKDIGYVLDSFDHNPAARIKICRLLDIQTPEETRDQFAELSTTAAIDSAAAARSSADAAGKANKHAMYSNWIALAALIVSIVAVLIALMARGQSAAP